MVEIDGSFGEGGGQIVRSSLVLAIVTQKPVTVYNLRARRGNPGLRRQHLTAVQAAREICRGEVEGAELGSRQIIFRPRPVVAGNYTFDVGSAGSTTLVLQTILPALMVAGGSSQLRLQGGTHNPFAPPFDFLAMAYAPLVERMGPRIRLELKRYGFYPAGQGELRVSVQPAAQLQPLVLLERGKPLGQQARAVVANLPLHIAEREIGTLAAELGWKKKQLRAEEVESAGPGNVVMAEMQFSQLTELFTGFGQKGVRAERVAAGVARQVRTYLRTEAPVGEHLADQLLLPLGICAQHGGTSRFRTGPLSGHALTHVEVLKHFLDADVSVAAADDGSCVVEVKPSA